MLDPGPWYRQLELRPTADVLWTGMARKLLEPLLISALKQSLTPIAFLVNIILFWWKSLIQKK